jgi:preprotein translocase subunit SecG
MDCFVVPPRNDEDRFQPILINPDTTLPMLTFFILFHIVVAVLLIGAVLLQKNDANALGGLGGSGGGMSMGGVISTRASKTFLTKVTTILAMIFFANSLALAILSHRAPAQGGGSIADEIIKQQTQGAPMSKPAPTATPGSPAAPDVPLAK